MLDVQARLRWQSFIKIERLSQEYQMMTTSVTGVKFIKTKVIFSYHTKGASNQVSSNLNHKDKSY